jgi:DNA-binding transcriptional regulator YiaG
MVLIMNKIEFFLWCEERSLSKNGEIARLFRLSSQTVRNWRKKKDAEILPTWVNWACHGLDTEEQRETASKIAHMTVEKLSAWQRRNEFKTLDDTAGVFDIERQAVHNWYKRGRFPRWLSLACAGYDLHKRTKSRKEKSIAA